MADSFFPSFSLSYLKKIKNQQYRLMTHLLVAKHNIAALLTVTYLR